MTSDLSALANTFTEIKSQIDELQKELETVKANILEMIEPALDGTTTIKLTNFNVSVTSKVNRKAVQDKASLESLFHEIGSVAYNDIFRAETKVNEKSFKEYQKYKPDIFKKLVPYITEKPSKPAVKVVEA